MLKYFLVDLLYEISLGTWIFLIYEPRRDNRFKMGAGKTLKNVIISEKGGALKREVESASL